MRGLKHCPFYGSESRLVGPLLGTYYFICDSCMVETKFYEVGLHIDKQFDRYNTRYEENND